MPAETAARATLPIPVPPIGSVPAHPAPSRGLSAAPAPPPRGSIPVSQGKEVGRARSPIVRDVMTTNLVTTGTDARLDSVARLLRYHGISGVPVVKGVHLEGVLSEKDILRTLAEHGGLSVASEIIDHVLEAPSQDRQVRRARWRGMLERLRVQEAMTSPAVTITEDASLDSALRWMLVKHVQRLPVMAGGHLVGIITRGDVMTSIEGER
ncbi:MAG: CBS domain-containing protein [Euryarchaeota archaeon]|nr:CBS domain-containing protein [Euryarchaeota archaeon]